MKKKLRIIVLLVIVLVVGGIVGGAVTDLVMPRPAQQVVIDQGSNATQTAETASTSTGSLGLLNDDVAYQSDQHFIINFEDLRSRYAAIINQYPENTYVYFDYLNNASTIGSNAQALFTAASTVKVPLAMAVFRTAEEGKINMSDQYTLQQSDLNSQFGTLYEVGAGKTYTIQQLVAIMLEQSDNTAMNALLSVFKNIGIADPFQDVYQQMGWTNFPTIGQTTGYSSYININAHVLANMFLALYNASYDNPADSQQILSYLTQTLFNDQIVAGVPPGVVVAHKIGVAATDNTYSDCGIVYAPSRPYILCVGVSSATQQQANQFIAEISSSTYQYVINN